MRLARSALLICLFAGAPALATDPFAGWTLFTPATDTDFGTYLIDIDGNVVHTWPSAYRAGMSVSLLADGKLLRCSADPSVSPIQGPGSGGRLERIAWDGTSEWNFVLGGPTYVQHHDAIELPNGNILAIVWDLHTPAEAIAMGRNPTQIGPEFWSEKIVEVEPVGATGGNIVWEWRVWDHLIQEFDPLLPNYGSPSDNPGRVDINYPSGPVINWLHINGIDYNPELDQIALSSRLLNEIWVISHDPTSNGDILYRWGNPQAYGRGTAADRVLDGQHDVQWIDPGLPGAGNLIVYNNGTQRGYSSIDEITPPLNPDGTYALAPGAPYGPEALTHTCDAIDGVPFFSAFISGVQRLPNGNDLVCIGLSGQFVEVDAACTSVWNYAAGDAVFRATRVGAMDERLESLLWFPDSDFVRGDVTGDGGINLADGVQILQWLFAAGPAPDCLDAADVDDTGAVDIADPLRIFGYLFQGLAPPPAPATCGADPTTGDSLDCGSAAACP